MNDLPDFNSTSQLPTTHIQDVFNVIVLPVLSGIGLPLKIASIVVLSIIIKKNKQKRNIKHTNMFHYMLVYEVGDLLQGVFVCVGALVRCGAYCQYGYDFTSKVSPQTKLF